jgi:hypothetical protein
MMRDVRRRHDAFHELGQIDAAADFLQAATAAQDIRDGVEIDGVMAFQERHHRVINQAMRLLVEPDTLTGGQDFDHGQQLIGIHENGAQEDALGLDGGRDG